MTLTHTLRRAALLGGAIAVVSCDVASFATDPKPIFQPLWSLPAASTTIGVASLLPSGNPPPVTVLPDSSAFQMSISNVAISRVVGNDCAQCVTLNGTTAPKPAFVLQAGNASALPNNVVSGTITGGTLNVQITNNMSFDPLYVNTTPGATTQGFMVLVVSSCSAVLGRDSVRGAATNLGPKDQPWPKNGGVLNRVIPLNAGTVGASCAQSGLRVDVTLNSPQGDHNEFINANGTLDASAAVNNLLVSSVSVNVVNNTMTAANKTLNLKGVDSSVTKRMIEGGMQLDITNPFAVTGNLAIQFGSQAPDTGTVLKSIAIASAGFQRTFVTLDSNEVRRIVGKNTTLAVSGTVNSNAPITLTPKQIVSIATRILLKLRVGG